MVTQEAETKDTKPETSRMQGMKKNQEKNISIIITIVVFVFVTYGIISNFSRFRQKFIQPQFPPQKTPQDNQPEQKVEATVLPEEEITIETEEATFSAGGNVDTKTFPADIPKYPNATVKSNLTTKTGAIIELTSPDDLTEITDFYQAQLEKLNWTITSKTTIQNASIFAIEKGDLEGGVIVNDSEDGTQITIDFAQKE